MAQTIESDDRRREATWIDQALRGEAAGFEALVRQYHAPLRRLLRSMVRNAEDAEDLLQETFLRAYRFLHRFDPARPFGPWLMRIGANLARNHLRRRPGAREVSLEGTTADEEGPHEGSWLADLTTVSDVAYEQLVEATRAAVDQLPADQRVVLELRLWAEMSYKEIAAALGIPIGTVMSRLNRGRQRIQAVLRAESSAQPGEVP